MGKYDKLIKLDDIYKTIEDEVENKELAEFIIKEFKNERNNLLRVINYNECLRNDNEILRNKIKGISSFSNEELIEEISKRLNGDKNET